MNNERKLEDFNRECLQDFFVDKLLSHEQLKKGLAELISISENEIFIYEDDNELLKEIDKNDMNPYLLQIRYVIVKGDFSLLLMLEPADPDVSKKIRDIGQKIYTFISDFSDKFQCYCAIVAWESDPIAQSDDFYLINGRKHRELIYLDQPDNEEKPNPDDDTDYYFICKIGE
jgi:hypothetical protein